MRLKFRLLLIFTLVLMIFGQHQTALAVNMFKFKGQVANASFSSVDGCIQTIVGLFAVEAAVQDHPDRRGPYSSVNIFMSQYDLCTSTQVLVAQGVADLAEEAFQIDPKLEWARLITTVTLRDRQTANTFDITIDLAWTGIAPVTRQHNNIHFGDEECKVHSRFVGRFRESEAIGTVTNGITNFARESSMDALLISSNSSEMVIGCD